MAPERFEGQSRPRSDVYGLGLTLYELLTLRPAFDDAEPAQLIEQVLHEPPPPPRKLDPRIPRDLETIVLKAMRQGPGRPLRHGRGAGRGPAALPGGPADPGAAGAGGASGSGAGAGATRRWRACRGHRAVAGRRGRRLDPHGVVLARQQARRAGQALALEVERGADHGPGPPAGPTLHQPARASARRWPSRNRSA